MMKEWITKGQFHLNSLGALPLPLSPSIEVNSVTPHRSTIFKSAMAPLAVGFNTNNYINNNNNNLNHNLNNNPQINKEFIVSFFFFFF